MRSTRAFRAGIAAAAITSMLLMAEPAMGEVITLFEASDFFIPRPASATDQEGVERRIATFDLAANGHADLIGQDCRFRVSEDNGDSVNENNYAVLRTGGSETDISDTESAANVTPTVLSDDLLTMGPTIEMFNVMVAGPGDIVGTSVDFAVMVDCSVLATTTTSSSTASTTTAIPGRISTTTTTTDAGSTSTTVRHDLEHRTRSIDLGSVLNDHSAIIGWNAAVHGIERRHGAPCDVRWPDRARRGRRAGLQAQGTPERVTDPARLASGRVWKPPPYRAPVASSP